MIPALSLLLAVMQVNQLWFAFPLILAVSLVYAATRHELMIPILQHAGHVALWIAAFMAIVFGLIYAVAMML